jgi:HK97 family phage portal protein
VGLLDGFRAAVEPRDTELIVERAEGDAWTEALAAIIEARQAGFTLAQALKLPPVIRGVALIAGVGSSMLPLVYRDGAALVEQPRIVRKPDPFGTRYTFLYQTLDAMISDRYGEAFWHLLDHDERGYPRAAMVIPNGEVQVTWDERGFLPRYRWRGRELVRDVDIKHIAPNRRPGELHGHGPLHDALDYLYPVAEAEAFASGFFSSGGIPLTVLKTAALLSEEQAGDLKAQWMSSRTTTAEPAVASGGVDVEFPAVDPEKAQLVQARGAGAAVVARILGIPASLLHVETSGATITYVNAYGALDELVKTTVAPLYLTPLEQAWSELVPGNQAVRFELGDLQRADIAGRFAVYSSAIADGIMTPEEARRYEGWAVDNTETAHLFDPEPVPAR